MPTAKLTKRVVESVAPSDKDSYLWDRLLPGFGVKITPTGSRVYLVQYRIGGRRGRTRRVTIGRHGVLTPQKARQRATKLLGQVADSKDPAEDKAKLRNDPTVAELCKVYLAEGCATKKPGTVANDRSRIKRHIEPLLGTRRAGSITRGDVERFLASVAAGKTAVDEKTGKPRGRAIVKGGQGIASRTVELLGSIFGFAIARGLRADNPVRGVKRFARPKRERFLSHAELFRLGDALIAAANHGENAAAIAAIRLLLLTGCRKSEILAARWEWVDFERRCLSLPDSKTGARVVPLAAPALAILAALPRIKGNPYVLAGKKTGQHLVGLQKIWKRVVIRAELDGMRIHDLRHSFASIAVAGGDSLFLVGKVLGHRQARTTEVYAHLSDDPVKATADRTAKAIEAAMRGESGQIVHTSIQASNETRATR